MTFDPDQGVLVVGGQTALLEHEPPVDAVVGTYVELVVAQRAVAPATREDLRDRELAELAGLLHLPPAELDALIDRELDRLLGRVHESDDVPERAPPSTGHRRHRVRPRRRRVGCRGRCRHDGLRLRRHRRGRASRRSTCPAAAPPPGPSRLPCRPAMASTSAAPSSSSATPRAVPYGRPVAVDPSALFDSNLRLVRYGSVA